MSKEERKTNISDSNNLDDADENEVLTLSELLEEQRQLDEVIFLFSRKNTMKWEKNQLNWQKTNNSCWFFLGCRRCVGRFWWEFLYISTG